MAFFKDPLAGADYSPGRLTTSDMNAWIRGIRSAVYGMQAATARTWLYETDITATVANFAAKCCTYSHSLRMWVIGGAISGSATNAIVTTEDSVTMTGRTVPNVGGANSIDAIASAWQAATIVGGCDDGNFRRSTDASSWTEVAPAAISSVTCMHHGGRVGLSNFFAGSTGEVERSNTGGSSWYGSTAFPSSLSSHDIKDIADNADSTNPILVAVGNTGSTDKCARSVDGATWTEGTMPSSTNWNSVTWSHNLDAFVAVNEGASAWATSTDGTTWSTLTPTTGPGSNVAMIRCLGKVLVAVKSTSGNIEVSTDDGDYWGSAHVATGTLTNVDQRALAFAETTTGGGQLGVAENVYFLASMSTGA